MNYNGITAYPTRTDTGIPGAYASAPDGNPIFVIETACLPQDAPPPPTVRVDGIEYGFSHLTSDEKVVFKQTTKKVLENA